MTQANVPDVMIENPQPTRPILFEVIDRTGDTKHIWDADKPAEVEAARSLFNTLIAKSYLAFRVTDRKGEKGEQVRSFDASHERLIFAPPMVGG